MRPHPNSHPRVFYFSIRIGRIKRYGFARACSCAAVKRALPARSRIQALYEVVS